MKLKLKRVKRKNKDGSERIYVQIVYSTWNSKKKRADNVVVGTLGREDKIAAGSLDSLIAGLMVYSEKALLNPQSELFAESAMSLGPRVIFDHLWRKAGLEKVMKEVGLSEIARQAIHTMVLCRIEAPCSKRKTALSCDEFTLPDEELPSLNTLYRALDKLHPVRVKIENKLYNNSLASNSQLNLFDTYLDIMFFDTTSVVVHAKETDLFKRGFSKDHRPDLPQFMVGLLVGTDGEPLCQYVFPGNTADVNALSTALNDIKKRFPIRNVTIVADRGCVSKDILNTILSQGMNYIVGSRMRVESVVHNEVLSKPGQWTNYDSILRFKVKEIDGTRYVVVQNKELLEHDRSTRKALLEKLKGIEGKDYKSLIRNRGYKKFLKAGSKIEIDHDKIKQEARFDGKWVLKTNRQDMTPQDIIETYKTLWKTERWFHHMKSLHKIRPVFHWKKERVEAHAFICFLAMKIFHHFEKNYTLENPTEWTREAWQNLKSLKGVTLEVGGKRIFIRNELTSEQQKLFKAQGCQPPKRVTILGVTSGTAASKMSDSQRDTSEL
jgi:transposase